MEALRIRTHLGSDTLHFPELRGMVGKDVEIIVMEEDGQTSGSAPDLEAFLSAAGKIDIDEGAIEQLRQESMI